MPLYEYYCGDCHGVFELLRSIRLAAKPQPCPDCDGDSKRIVSRDFAVFTTRRGEPRRLPDRGTFWHLGKEVSQPISGSVRPNEHQELNRPDPLRPLSVEDLERFEAATDAAEAHGQEQEEVLGTRIQSSGGQSDTFTTVRRLNVKGTQREQHVKRRILKKYRGSGR